MNNIGKLLHHPCSANFVHHRLSNNRGRSVEFGSGMILLWQGRLTHRYENRAVVPHHYQRWAVTWNIAESCRFHANGLTDKTGTTLTEFLRHLCRLFSILVLASTEWCESRFESLKRCFKYESCHCYTKISRLTIIVYFFLKSNK